MARCRTSHPCFLRRLMRGPLRGGLRTNLEVVGVLGLLGCIRAIFEWESTCSL